MGYGRVTEDGGAIYVEGRTIDIIDPETRERWGKTLLIGAKAPADAAGFSAAYGFVLHAHMEEAFAKTVKFRTVVLGEQRVEELYQPAPVTRHIGVDFGSGPSVTIFGVVFNGTYRRV